MRVVVTRPEREALRWVDSLAARGHEPVLLPLIDVVPLDPQAAPAAVAALGDAWRQLALFSAVMFVSAPAVAHFFAVRPAHAPWPGVRAWAPGPGTVQALLAHGVPAGLIDGPSADAPQFDSERLWAQVAAQVTGRAGTTAPRVLFVRGGNAAGIPRGRDWLAQQVAAAGGACEDVVAYERRRPVWTPAQAGAARLAAAGGAVWLFSSSEAVANLAALLPNQPWQGAAAVATHPRIAEAARDAGFGVVRESRPAWDAVLASIESMA